MYNISKEINSMYTIYDTSLGICSCSCIYSYESIT
jgi:hypothetical protein